jgi:hypothetical protein
MIRSCLDDEALMHKFVIPALDLLHQRLQKGFSPRQKMAAALLGLLILMNFMFRAACPPERRFVRSATSGTLAICATSDLVRNSLPLGAARNAKFSDGGPHPFAM